MGKKRKKAAHGRHHHDSLYKQLFSNKDLLLDFLRGYLQEYLREDFDLDTLRLRPTEHIRDGLKVSHSDLIWEVQATSSRFYLVLMFEFQNRNEKWMAIRLLEYIAMLWKGTINAHTTDNPDELPLVLPMVLYNGDDRWTAQTDLSRLLPQNSETFHKFQPIFSYLVFDIRHALKYDIFGDNNIATALFALQNARSADNAFEIVKHLRQLLKCDNVHPLEQVFINFIRENCIDNKELTAYLENCKTLDEVVAMAPKTLTQIWAETAHREGLEEGLEKGKREGREEGREEGRKEGRKEGREEGLGIGFRKSILTYLTKMYGIIPRHVQDEIESIGDVSVLNKIFEFAIQTKSLDEFQAGLPQHS